MNQFVQSKDGIKLKFPIVNIGQFDKKTMAIIEREVRRGNLVKYEDFTFPRTKNGYAIAHGNNAEAQALIESSRSLLNGSWVYVPDAQLKVERKIIAKLESIRTA